MVKELISRVFATRNQAHLEHWKTSSYAQHVALGDFYDSLIDHMDTFVEAYQGNFGVIKNIKLEQCSCDIMEHLEEDLVWIEKNYEEITQDVCALENILDGIVELYLTTRYKLKQLS